MLVLVLEKRDVVGLGVVREVRGGERDASVVLSKGRRLCEEGHQAF